MMRWLLPKWPKRFLSTLQEKLSSSFIHQALSSNSFCLEDRLKLPTLVKPLPINILSPSIDFFGILNKLETSGLSREQSEALTRVMAGIVEEQ
jgi:hypothetical protein